MSRRNKLFVQFTTSFKKLTCQIVPKSCVTFIYQPTWFIIPTRVLDQFYIEDEKETVSKQPKQREKRQEGKLPEPNEKERESKSR